MFFRPVEVVRLALVGGFPSEEELDRTADDIFGGPLSTRLIRWGRPSVDSMTALLDNGSFA